MTAKRKLKADPAPPYPRYSWHPQWKASPRCIRHFVRQALRHKIWAYQTTPQWYASASTVSQEMRDGYRDKPIKLIAREALEYARHRARLGATSTEVAGGPTAVHSWPWDRPARLLWLKLSLSDKAKATP